MTNDLCLLSFDIGIKNLSYCMITRSENGEDVIIKDWKVLDISRDESIIDVEEHKCSCMTKEKKNQVNKICGKNVKYEKLGNYYCEKHAKSTNDFIIPFKEIEKKEINRLKKKELIALGMKYNILTVENDSDTKKSIMDKIEAYFLVKCFVPIKKNKNINASDINLIVLGRNMKRVLDEVNNFDNITHIILENQISTIASRMKSVQAMVMQYFIMKLHKDVHIQFVSSLNKLKSFPKRSSIEDVKNIYKQHKADAIYHTEQILQKNKALSSWIDMFNKSKKMDDLSDSMLQGIWFLGHIKFLKISESYILSTCIIPHSDS
jgi:hypothetical protein